MACCPIPDFLEPKLVEKCAAAIIDDKDSPMDMAYGMTQEDVLFWPGIRVKHIFWKTYWNYILNLRIYSAQCISQCIMNESKVIVNETVEVDRAMNVLVQKFENSEDWLPVLRKAMQTCDSIGKVFSFRQHIISNQFFLFKHKSVAKTPFKRTPEDECSFLPAFFMACVDTQIFQVILFLTIALFT